jgi:DNA-binding transcriptional regulator of glucitol operon
MLMKRRRCLAVFGIAFIILFLWTWAPWAKYRYHGDGTFTDSGFFGYPRYQVRFTKVSLSKVAEYRYHFRGLPDEQMSLLLSMDRDIAFESTQWHEMTSLQTTIEAVVTDGRGREACKAVGSPEDNNRDGVWVLTTGFGTSFWHRRCTDVQVRPSQSYELMLRIKTIDPRSGDLAVTPILEGGGIELP